MKDHAILITDIYKPISIIHLVGIAIPPLAFRDMPISNINCQSPYIQRHVTVNHPFIAQPDKCFLRYLSHLYLSLYIA